MLLKIAPENKYLRKIHKLFFFAFALRSNALTVAIALVISTGFLVSVRIANTSATSPTDPYITGDLNVDGTVNITDLSVLLSKWGTNYAAADINNDGTVNLVDLSTLLSNWTGPFTFDDEFNGTAGSQPSSSLWSMVNNQPYSTTELQCYENSTSNVAEDGAGNLKLTALSAPSTNCNGVNENYTSGRLQTISTFNQKYGTIAMRAKLPTAKGMFPAFWMVGTNTATLHDPCDGEIDIMETIGSDTGSNWSDSTIHGPNTAGNCPTAYYSDSNKWTNSADLSSDYHVYSVKWSPGSMIFKVDGNTVYTITKAILPAGQNWVFDTDPEYLILNLAIGGPWAGAPDGNTIFPQSMYVDYVRVTNN